MSDVLPRLSTALESRYRIAREAGVGGMATVYLAHDLRHERDVAIKVLHPDLAAALGSERFLAEIKTTAKLQHPHILPLLDSGEASGLLYYVMPYVDGESLRARLDRETQLAVEDAIRIAREVASALDYAHRHGVVHRDIKPENILIHEDQALVADFGIALAVKAAGGARMTQTGLSLGTPAYMAPEQAMGERAIDGRADIYALGAVTYEMLVGEAPFTGPTVQAIVARVMTETPRPVTGQRKSVPANVNAAVLRALEKLPADRFHSPAEFSAALVATSVEPRSATAAAVTSTRDRFSIKTSLPWAVAGVAAAAAIFFAATRGSDSSNAKAMYFAVELPATFQLPPGQVDVLGVSPDGSTIAFGAIGPGGRTQLFLKNIHQDEIRTVKGSDGVAGSPVFSPDGRWLAFGDGKKVYKIPVKGGDPIELADAQWAQMDWIGNEAVIHTTSYDSGLNRVSADGRTKSVLTKPDRAHGELGHWWPQVLPDGDHVLFTNYTTPANKSKIEVLSLKTGKRQVVLEGGYYGRYVSNHLIFARDAGMMVVPFDAGSFKANGDAGPLPLDVEISPPNGWAALAVSPTGLLVYRTDALKSVTISWADEDGNETPALDSAARFRDATVSPDGRKIALVRDGDVWIYDLQRKIFSRLTQTDQLEEDLLWSPDSRELFYVRDVPQYEIFKRAADGSRPEQLAVTSPKDKDLGSISPDGKTLLYDDDADGKDRIYATSPNPDDRAEKKLVLGGDVRYQRPAFSPDGRWIAYMINESGRPEVYVSPYPVDRGPARIQVSDAGGNAPQWSKDGQTIYYSWGGRLFKARVNPESGDIGTPEMLRKIQPHLFWSLAPDGRFLIGRVSKSAERHALKVILNWPKTLEN
jgi:serine/threonine-protein kinase